MKKNKIILGIVIALIILTPLPFYLSGLGQKALFISNELGIASDGLPLSSPRAELWHQFTLPLRLWRLLLYPMLLWFIMRSSSSMGLRDWSASLLKRLAGRFPSSWRSRIASPAGSALLFILALEAVIFLIYLPLSFYSGFILRRQFGLSTQDFFSWAHDAGLNFVIGVIMDALSYGILYALIIRFPRRWPIFAGLLLTVSSAVMMVIYPLFITPLFYQVQPLADSSMRERILQIGQRAGLSISNVYVIDASSKSTEANAYVEGLGGQQRIVLYDTLLRDFSPEQVDIVLAHEIGHWHYHHLLLGLLGGSAAAWLGLFALRWLLDRSWRRLGLRSAGDIAGLPGLLLVIYLVSVLILPLENSLSRFSESQADQFAFQINRQPQAAVDLFEGFARQNLSLINPPDWEQFIFGTHPTLKERILMAREYLPPPS